MVAQFGSSVTRNARGSTNTAPFRAAFDGNWTQEIVRSSCSKSCSGKIVKHPSMGPVCVKQTIIPDGPGAAPRFADLKILFRMRKRHRARGSEQPTSPLILVQEMPLLKLVDDNSAIGPMLLLWKTQCAKPGSPCLLRLLPEWLKMHILRSNPSTRPSETCRNNFYPRSCLLTSSTLCRRSPP